MNLFDILFMAKTGTIKPDASLFDIMFAQKLRAAAEKIVTIIGNPLSFITKKAQTAISTKISMEPIQEGSGDPSPTNIRPISGRTGVTLGGCGKNALKTVNGQYQSSYVDFDAIGDNGKITLTGTTSQSFIAIWNFARLAWDGSHQSNNAKNIKNGRYKCKGLIHGTRLQIYGTNVYDATTNEDIHPLGSFRSDLPDTEIIIDDTYKYNYCRLFVSQNESYNSESFYPMIYPSYLDNPEFEPYQSSNEITISFGETVYGGTLDVETGVLTVDKQFFVFDDANKINAIAEITGGGTVVPFYRYIINNAVAVAPQILSARGCSHFVNATVNTQSTVYGYYAYTSGNIGNNDVYLQFRNTDLFNTLVGCKAWFTEQMDNGTPVQCWFTLATPRTISLTPEEVQLLKGVNNIWTDGDEIELTYIA